MIQIAPIVWQIVFVAFCLIIAIQIFYYLFFFRRLAIYTKPKKETSQEYAVSIVVCARDEANQLSNNLPGILVQNYKTTHEVVVVNDNSVDDTKYLLDEFKKSFKNINQILLSQEAKLISGKKFPLSMGIKSAKYEVLLLTDADCVPSSENWISAMQNGYTDDIEIVLGYGAYKKKKGILNKLIRFDTFHTALQYLSYALAGLPYMGVGRNLSYKKEVFIRNKGFSSINMIPSGDDDLFINQVANKKNIAIVIDASAHTISNPKSTWTEWMKQKYRHYTTAKYYKPFHQFLLGLYSISLTILYPLFIISIIFYCWWLSLAIYGVRLLVQAFIYFKTMKKLNEFDLFPWFILLDMWMPIYFLITLPAIWKSPNNNWK